MSATVNWVRIFASVEEANRRLELKRPQLVIIGERKICLLRTAERTYRAFQDSCSHNGESLSKGHVNFRDEIICPWHNYCFDTATGQEIRSRSSDLQTYAVRADGEGFFIGI